MLFHALSDRPHDVDVERIVGRLAETIEPAAFAQAASALTARHEALRTRFVVEDAQPTAEVLAAHHPVVHVEDWRGRPAERIDADVESFLENDGVAGFVLGAVSPSRFALLVHDRGTVVVWTVAHALCDGRSFVPALRELFAHYDHARGGAAPMVESAPPFSQHAMAPPSCDAATAEAFWTRRLDGLAAATPLPVDPRPLVGRGAGRIESRIDRTIAEELRRRCTANGVDAIDAYHAALALLLGRHAVTDDVTFGAVLAGRGTKSADAATIGCFLQTVPLRVAIDRAATVDTWLTNVRTRRSELRPHAAPLYDIQRWSPLGAGRPLTEALLVCDRRSLQAEWEATARTRRDARWTLYERTGHPLSLSVYDDASPLLRLTFDRERFTAATAAELLARFSTIVAAIATSTTTSTVRELSWLPADERERLRTARHGPRISIPTGGVHREILARARAESDAIAVFDGESERTFADLDAQSGALAQRLVDAGVRAGDRVGIAVARSARLPIAMLAVLRTGAAYVPLDPDHPPARLAQILDDARPSVVVADMASALRLPADMRVVAVDGLPSGDGPAPDVDVTADDVAYVLHTSGSTGRPKGVVVTHGNLQSFFVAMDERLGTERGVWLAVTSPSFDISVLELLWTLRVGHRVVVDTERPTSGGGGSGAGGVDLSLFYFAAADDHGGDRYRLLREGARFADANGFVAVWTPERHFHPFGGLYPNPAVTGAALAVWTQRVEIRAGSVVLPLHHPARVAEEWSVVDNLSGGRVAISVASGWHPSDFALAPANYADRKPRMFDAITTLRALWRGERQTFATAAGDADLGVWPRPVQRELPIWVTAAGNPETYAQAGAIGANVLTHLLGQSDADLAANIATYRRAFTAAGHPGRGRVAVMLHTFVGDDDAAVKELVRAPMLRYLASSVDLARPVASAWSAFQRGAGSVPSADAIESLTEAERTDLLAFAFERYFETSGLFGTPERCARVVERMHSLGADEIACLIDFGVDENAVLAMLPALAQLRGVGSRPASSPHAITHLQCTPSRARLWLADPSRSRTFAGLTTLLLGGEALDAALRDRIREVFHGRLWNVYGPTETTVWSTAHDVTETGAVVPIGTPLANETAFVVDDDGALVPDGVVGELVIGGAGVARGYLDRPEATAERFVVGPDGTRCYRTGDRVRRRTDGVLEILGRDDQQVKVRGVRIELAEVEAALCRAGASEAAARVEIDGDVAVLVAFVVGVEPEAARQRLVDDVPAAMVPTRIQRLAALPRTPNGKLDRAALTRSVPTVEPTRTARPPSQAADVGHDLEVRLTAHWSEVLGRATVARGDNFFDLGGHSLLALRLHARLQAEFAGVAITDLFRFPSVATFAEFLRSRTAPAHADVEPSVTLPRPGIDRAAARRAAQAALRRGRGD